MTQNIIQTLIGLGIVVGLFLVLAWLVSRFGRGTLLASSEMRIVANLPLGARERVVVVDVGGQQLVLGVTPQQINTLHTFDEPALGKNRLDKSKSKGPSDFRQKLQEILGGSRFRQHVIGESSPEKE